MARMGDYSDKVLEHLNHPRHMGLIPESAVNSATERLLAADAGPTPRGDRLRLTIKLRIADEAILDAGFQTPGRMPISSASCFCSMIVGKTVAQAAEVTVQDMNLALEGLPETRHRQPVLVVDAFDTIVRQTRGLPPRARLGPDETPVCICCQVPEVEIERAIRLQNATTVDEVTAATRACSGCGSCRADIEDIIARCQRGEYNHHIPPADYEAAHRQRGTPRPSAEELARNPPPA